MNERKLNFLAKESLKSNENNQNLQAHGKNEIGQKDKFIEASKFFKDNQKRKPKDSEGGRSSNKK